VLKIIAAGVGTWDILVLNAGFISDPAPVTETAVDDWWQSFEVRSFLVLSFPVLVFSSTPYTGGTSDVIAARQT